MVRRASLALLVAAMSACDAVVGIPGQVSLASAQGSLDSGAPDAPPSPDAAEQCPPANDTDPCFQCTDTNCCVEYDACQADPRCGLYYKECLPQCKAAGNTYAACVVQCDSTNGAGHAVFAPYDACGESKCLAQCSRGMQQDPCVSCMYASCGAEISACTGDAECDTLFECVVLCQGQANYDQCAASCAQGKSAMAQQLQNQEVSCELQFCQQACGAP
jgi:hypothetical protein